MQWTELALQERLAGNSGLLVFAASVVFVFLLLAAQYESWTLPLSVILIVPMCLLVAVTGLLLFSMDVNILAQIGFVVLIGLAAKNVILIVEFARQAEDEGVTRIRAVVQAARIRLRPILMTSLAFIFGVVPLVIATGAGAEMRQSLGATVQPGRTPDKAGARELYKVLRAAFPDFRAEIHWQLADGDRVTTYKTYHGTHRGEFFGVAPTGRKIQFETVDVMRVRDGQIAEHWGVANLFSLMQQLGATPGNQNRS